MYIYIYIYIYTYMYSAGSFNIIWVWIIKQNMSMNNQNKCTVSVCTCVCWYVCGCQVRVRTGTPVRRMWSGTLETYMSKRWFRVSADTVFPCLNMGPTLLQNMNTLQAMKTVFRDSYETFCMKTTTLERCDRMFFNLFKTTKGGYPG